MKPGNCKHFNGIQHACCDAGINYDALLGNDNERALPCIRIMRERVGDRQIATCEKYSEPTAEEIAEDQRLNKEALSRALKAMPLILRIKQEHKGESWGGIETCPVCGGRLHLSHAKSNGHVWGKCETEGCLAWME